MEGRRSSWEELGEERNGAFDQVEQFNKEWEQRLTFSDPRFVDRFLDQRLAVVLFIEELGGRKTKLVAWEQEVKKSAETGGDTPDAVGSGPQHPGFMTRGIDDPRHYYYRRVITDAVRAVGAARSHPLVDADRIAVTGESQGGGLTLAVAGLVPDLRAALPDVPFLCDFRRGTHVASTGIAVSDAAASCTFHMGPPYASTNWVKACGSVNLSLLERKTIGSR